MPDKRADDDPRPAYCGICGATVPTLTDAIKHLATAHGIDEDLERWPDGEPVVVDHTLEPRDFAP